jgi:hypothetical protein
LQIGSGEIATLEKQRFAPDFCQSIAGAIDDIQLSRMASPLSISPESLKSCLGHFWIERHNNDTGMIKHLVKIHGPPCRRGRDCNTILVSSTVTDEIVKDAAPSIAC